MDSVIIVAPFAYDTELKVRLEQVGPVTTGSKGVLVVDDGTSRVYVSRNDAVFDELEPERLGLINSTIRNPVFYSLDFSDIALCRKVLEFVANDSKLVVDNDHGVVLPGPEFVRLLHSRRDWDWRTNARDPEIPNYS